MNLKELPFRILSRQYVQDGEETLSVLDHILMSRLGPQVMTMMS